jgi:trehalose/maltose transport system permease protein
VGRARDIRLAYLLLAPALLLLLTVLAYPIGWEVWTSFTNLSPLNDGSTAFVGLANYSRLLAGADFWQLARPFRGRVFVFLAIFLPWAYPAGVSVIGWYWTLNPPTTTAYAPFMGQLKFVVDSTFGTGAWAFVSVILFNIWRGSSFIGVLLLAGINAVPPELFECAVLESKSPWRRFWLVTVPLLKPFLALAVFLSLTSAFADLANVWMLTAGRIVFPIIGTHAYFLAIKAGQFGPASALSLTLVPVLLGILLVLFRFFDPPRQET